MVPYSIEFFVYEKLEVQKCTWTYISEQWHPCRCCKQSPTYQNGQGCPWFHAVATFLHSKNSPSANVHGCTFADDVSTPSICKSAAKKHLIRLPLSMPCILCSMSRTECAIRHGCRWFQTETSFLLCKKLAVKNVQGRIFLTRWLQSAFIPLITPQSAGV